MIKYYLSNYLINLLIIVYFETGHTATEIVTEI